MSMIRVRILQLLAVALCVGLGCGTNAPNEPSKSWAAEKHEKSEKSRGKKTASPQASARVEDVLKHFSAEDAEDILQSADIFKAREEYEEAESHYLAALKKKPRLTMASYQLACNYALWGRKNSAMEWLKKAVDQGFWGYEMMKDDDDLKNIREAPDFPALLKKVQERYAVQAPKQAGGSMIRLPDGESPKSGWPVLVFLHGFGDAKESYFSLADSAAEQGFAGLAVSGPIVQYEKRFSWPTDSFETTHKFLNQQLQRHGDKPLDPARVFLLGFSQGAEHAAGLVALHPESYAGAIALSPGGLPGPQLAIRGKGPARPLFVTVGKKEPTGNRLTAKHWADDWRKAGWPVREEEHEGSHHFPLGWTDEFPEVLHWLLEGK
jgi:predicted esterase